jgi:hypothetical protein
VVSLSRRCGGLCSFIGIVSRLKDRRIFSRSFALGMRLSLLYSPHTKSSIQSASYPFRAGDFFHGYSSWEVKLTSHSSLVTSLRMHGAVLPFRHTPSWSALGQVSFVLHLTGLFLPLTVVTRAARTNPTWSVSYFVGY